MRGSQPLGDDFWTITADPSSRYGSYLVVGFDGHNDPSNTCMVKTTSPWPGGGTPSYRASGTPFVHINQQNSVTAFSTFTSWNGRQFNISATPLYGGLKVLDTYWEARSRFTGANLCRAEDCGGV